MKIAFFSGRALPKLGGVEIVVDSLASQISALGHEVQVIAPRRKFWSYHNDSYHPYSVFRYPPHAFSKKFFVKPYLRFLKNALKESKADILHVHEVWPHSYLAALLKKEVGIPVVLTSHGSDAISTSKRYNNINVLKKARWAIGEMDAVIANSPSMKKHLQQMLPGVCVTEISNGTYSVSQNLFRDRLRNAIAERSGIQIAFINKTQSNQRFVSSAANFRGS